ncbi:MAG: hypothetical protein ABF662_06835 [Liquorilactobacillus satsumensis]|uniref:hypothetical protein n=1 Tax=Liquorilactobacillus satsumensis TaxID=259059 RepID=UPI0039EAFF88
MMLLSQAKLADVIVSNVEKPKMVRVMTVSKNPRYADGGEPIQGTVAKIACQIIDVQLAQIIEKAGGDLSELKTYPLELVGEEKDLLSISEATLLGSEIKLDGAQVMLKWANGRNGGGWRDLKLVMNVSETGTGDQK